MGRGKRAEESGPGAPIWMVSFSDCMTNLLTFFILLLTFSAFGDMGGGQSAGVAPLKAGPSVHTSNLPPKEGLLPEVKDPARQTLEGSEKPNPEAGPVAAPGRPRAPIGLLDTEAYRDRKVLHLPSRLIFYGWGNYVTDGGRERLAQIARFLRLSACQVVIGESSSLHPNHPLFRRPQVSLERAWSVIEYFTETEDLPEDRFSVAAATSVAREAYNEEPVLEIVLMARRVYP